MGLGRLFAKIPHKMIGNMRMDTMEYGKINLAKVRINSYKLYTVNRALRKQIRSKRIRPIFLKARE